MEQPLPVSLVQVTDVMRITPHMARITFSGDDLAYSIGDAPDQQVKLCLPKPGQAVREPKRSSAWRCSQRRVTWNDSALDGPAGGAPAGGIGPPALGACTG